MNWVAALPMYNVTPALADDWRVLLDRVHRRLRLWLEARGDTLAVVDPETPLDEFWLREDLLLSQTCGYPLVKALAGRVQLVATPVFSVDGCAGGDYRSGHTPFDTLKPQLSSALMQKKFQAYIEDLKKNAKIEKKL